MLRREKCAIEGAGVGGSQHGVGVQSQKWAVSLA